jgi:hypothetical protein
MQSSDRAFQIAISYEKNIPNEIISAFVSDISAPGLDIRSEARETEVHAGVEWYIPTALIIFIGKAYFDSFLKEMGKEHYHLLKKGIISLWKYFFGHERSVKFNRVASNGKISAVPQYSIALSLMTDLSGQYRIKYLFKDNLSEDDFKKAIEHFFDFLEELSAGVLNPEIKQQLQNVRAVGHTILLTYDGSLKILNAIPERTKKSET